MPELPEVETVCRSLEPLITGKTVTDVQVYLPQIVHYPSQAVFAQTVISGVFQNIERRGKYILLNFKSTKPSAMQTLLVHLRMTGKLLYVPAKEPVGKHTHLVLTLDDGYTLRYDDVRKFGGVALHPHNLCAALPELAKLGPEPLGDAFTVQWLQEKMTGKKQKAKAFLLDQRNIAGIGNIYADEILFQAHIHPEEPVCNLTDDETVTLLWYAIRDRLTQGIAHGGSSIKDYVDSQGNAGTFQQLHKAYGRSGKPCVECGCLLERIVSAGRSSCYCPNCQPRRENKNNFK